MRTGTGQKRRDTVEKGAMPKSPGLEGRTTGFGPGWAPDFGLFLSSCDFGPVLILLGTGSPSVKCRSREV